MDNKRKFFYNGIMLTAVGIAMRTAALFFNAFITRTVGSEGIGLYTIVTTVYGFAVTFATSGISLTVTRLVAEAKGEGREEDISRILAGAVIYALLFSTVTTSVLYFGAGAIAGYILDDMRARAALRILAPSLIPLSLVSVFSGYFVGVRRVAYNATAQVMSQLFKISATVWLLLRALPLSVESSALYLALGTTATEILCFLVILAQFLIERHGKEKSRGAALGAVATATLPLAISAYIRQALLTLEHILIPKRLRVFGESASDALSSYGTLHGMALPLILYPLVTLNSFSGLLVPEFAERSARGDRGGMERLAALALEKTLGYAFITSAVLFIFSEELGYVIYNSHSAGYYVAVLAPVVPIMYLDHVTDSVLKGIGEQVYSMWVNITDSLLSVLLVWLLIPKMGIMGYAVCIIVMEGYNFILSLVRLTARIRVKLCWRRAVVYPALSAILAAYLTRTLFISAGAGSTALWCVLEIIFTLCAFYAFNKLLLLIDALVDKNREAEPS
ncbi:MAG: oligosaccharide flippase family protein [Clostridia bacterium]|nr:oligosaccharide flippase family protein [Clostridia bacterium]